MQEKTRRAITNEEEYSCVVSTRQRLRTLEISAREMHLKFSERISPSSDEAVLRVYASWSALTLHRVKTRRFARVFFTRLTLFPLFFFSLWRARFLGVFASHPNEMAAN